MKTFIFFTAFLFFFEVPASACDTLEQTNDYNIATDFRGNPDPNGMLMYSSKRNACKKSMVLSDLYKSTGRTPAHRICSDLRQEYQFSAALAGQNIVCKVGLYNRPVNDLPQPPNLRAFEVYDCLYGPVSLEALERRLSLCQEPRAGVRN